jgi:hypothetical protein
MGASCYRQQWLFGFYGIAISMPEATCVCLGDVGSFVALS